MSSANNQDILKILKKINKRLTAIETRLDANRDSKQVSNKEPSKKIVLKKTSTKIVKAGTIMMTKYNNACLLTGDTFDKKFVIKEFKGRWKPENKGWVVKIECYEKLYKKLKKVTNTINENELEEDMEGFTTGSKATTSDPINDTYGFISDSD